MGRRGASSSEAPRPLALDAGAPQQQRGVHLHVSVSSGRILVALIGNHLSLILVVVRPENFYGMTTTRLIDNHVDLHLFG